MPAGAGGWPPEKQRLYEFIVRSFLASCSKPAVGYETTVEIAIAEEAFTTSGVSLRPTNPETQTPENPKQKNPKPKMQAS